jgi:protein-S-isoprenylcysteine O-methyltransferase Ste14
MPRGKLIALGLFLLLWLMPFLGWGLDDVRGFLAHPARAAFSAAGILSLGAVVLFRLDFDPLREGARTSPRQKLPMLFGAFFLMAICFLLGYADRSSVFTLSETDAVRYGGLALVLAGITVRLAALRTLGRHFSGLLTVRDDHQLITSGLYGHVRHPMYLGGLLAWTGACLVFRSWLFVVLLPLAAVLLPRRISREESLLAEKLGEAYEGYRRRTWRLLPHLW